MNEDFRRLEDVSRLDDKNLIEDLANFIFNTKVEIEEDAKHHVFRSRYKGQIEALDRVYNWVSDYKRETLFDMEKVKEFISDIFPNWFIGIERTSVCGKTSVYHAIFELEDQGTEKNLEVKKRISDFVNLVDDRVFRKQKSYVLVPLVLFKEEPELMEGLSEE